MNSFHSAVLASSPCCNLANSSRARSARGRIRCGLGLDLFVDALHFGQGVLLIRRPVKKRTIADNQHAELGAPVAQMIVRLHRVAAKTQHPAERVAQDGGTNMTDVHGFGHVGGR